MATSDNQAILLQLSADVSKLAKKFGEGKDIVNKAANDMENRVDRMSKKINETSGKVNVGKALDSVFDNTRLKVLDSGVARVGIFGSALEELGPIGLTAAAGIAAVGVAFAGARQAAAFADDIADTANKLHVTTDALQEYRYAIRAAGGEEAGADQALEAFSITLGKAQAGLPKAIKAFKELGFSRKDIDGFKDVDTALKAVTERIAGLSNVQKDAVIDQLGLTGLKPLIDAGLDSMQTLRDEAHKVGIVMDAELVKRGGDVNDQFETVSKVIDVQLKSALVDLGPILVGLLGLMADMARAAGDIVDQFRSIENKTTQGLKDELERKLKQYNGAGYQPNTKDLLGIINPVTSSKTINRLVTEASLPKDVLKAQIDDLEARINARTASAVPAIPKTSLIDVSTKTGGGATRDTSAQRIASTAAAVAQADKDMLSALLTLTNDAETRAVIQKQIIDAETAQKTAQIEKQKADVAADKSLSAAKKAELTAALDGVAANAEAVAVIQKANLDLEAQEQTRQQALTLSEQALTGEEDLLNIRRDLATTSAEQMAISLRLVDLAYQREKAELEGVLASQTATEADKQLARLKLNQLNAQQPGKIEQARETGSDAARNVGGIISGIRGQTNAADEARAQYEEIDRLRQADKISEAEAAQAKAEVNAKYHEARLQQTSSFFGNLATLSESGNATLAAIGKAAAVTQATIDGVLAVQKALASAPPPLNYVLAAGVGVAAAVNVAKIAGFREGGYTGDRGLGEISGVVHGREFVVNAEATANNRPLLEAINAGRTFTAPSFAAPVLAGPSSVTNNSANPNFTYAPQVNAGTPSLEQMVQREARFMRKWIDNQIRNGAFKVAKA